MSESRKCKFGDLNTGDWFIVDGVICQRDGSSSAYVEFNSGRVAYANSDLAVKFIESVELIYD